MKTPLLKRAAFTLIELVMVIVILGIISMIGTDIISKMYQGYMHSKIVNDLQQKTELALDLITKRLQYRIKDAVISKNSANVNQFKLVATDDNLNYDILEWIGYDNEGFLGEYNGTTYVPGWSGFIDLKDSANTDENQTSTKGSHLTYAKNTILSLSYNGVDLSDSDVNKPSVAMIFKENFFGATPTTFGLNPGSTDHNDTYRVYMTAEDKLQFKDNLPDKYLSEQYYLAWTAYALVPHGKSDDFNLTLHYNYQPWDGDKFDDPGTKTSLVVEHVSTFRFTQKGTSLRIKLCIQDGNQTGTPIGFCKEKAVF